jgi:hypothetical protein
VLLSRFSSTELSVAIERNDLGAFAFPITRPPDSISVRTRHPRATNCRGLVSSEKIRVNAIAALRSLNPSRSKRF